MARSTKRNYFIFVSHSSLDNWVSKQIAAEITRCGAISFLDVVDIESGAHFEQDIRDALDKANELMILLTPWALKRPGWILTESGVAWKRQIKIIPVLYGLTPKEIIKNSIIPSHIKKLNLIDINQIEIYFNELKKRVKLL